MAKFADGSGSSSSSSSEIISTTYDAEGTQSESLLISNAQTWSIVIECRYAEIVFPISNQLNA